MKKIEVIATVGEDGRIYSQVPLVRCKDCHYSMKDDADRSLGTVHCRKMHDYRLDEWFCADGEKRT